MRQLNFRVEVGVLIRPASRFIGRPFDSLTSHVIALSPNDANSNLRGLRHGPMIGANSLPVKREEAFELLFVWLFAVLANFERFSIFHVFRFVFPIPVAEFFAEAFGLA